MSNHSQSIMPFKVIRFKPTYSCKVFKSTRITRTIKLDTPMKKQQYLSLPKVSEPPKVLVRSPSMQQSKLTQPSGSTYSTAINSSSVQTPLSVTLSRRNTCINMLSSPTSLKSPIEVFYKTDRSSFISKPTPLPQPVTVQISPVEARGAIPQAREGGVLISVKKHLILLGGQNVKKINDMVVFNTSSKAWKQIYPTGDLPGTLGHVAVSFNYTLYIFGGYSSSRGKKCSKKLFRLRGDEWEQLKYFGQSPGARRNQAYCQVGRTLLVYGGTDSDSQIRGDLHALDIPTFCWNLVESSDSPGPVSHATLTGVFLEESSGDFALGELWDHHRFDIKGNANFGFYLFGGIDGEWNPLNNLHLLQLVGDQLKWRAIQPAGSAPSPRFGHSAASLNQYLFIFGGRNDQVKDGDLGQLFVFDCVNSFWQEVIVYGQLPQERWGHGMTRQGESIYIFGGIYYSHYHRPVLYELSMVPM